MTDKTQGFLMEQRDRVQKALQKEYRRMKRAGRTQYTTKAIKCQYYLEELDTASELLENVYDVSQVSWGLIRVLNESGKGELETIFDGAFVNVSKVKKTGVYFVAVTPIAKI